jgi:hypothetical protein
MAGHQAVGGTGEAAVGKQRDGASGLRRRWLQLRQALLSCQARRMALHTE